MTEETFQKYFKKPKSLNIYFDANKVNIISLLIALKAPARNDRLYLETSYTQKLG